MTDIARVEQRRTHHRRIIAATSPRQEYAVAMRLRVLERVEERGEPSQFFRSQFSGQLVLVNVQHLSQ